MDYCQNGSRKMYKQLIQTDMFDGLTRWHHDSGAVWSNLEGLCWPCRDVGWYCLCIWNKFHSEVIDATLAKECELGRILGPFENPLLPNFRTFGLDLVPKHNGGWWIIYLLSAAPNSGTNHFINPDDYSRVWRCVKSVPYVDCGSSSRTFVNINNDNPAIICMYYNYIF